MQPISPVSPEARARHPDDEPEVHRLPLIKRIYVVGRRVVVGVYADGFIHAGNLAYLALLTLFPFFIVTAALAHVLGRGPDTMVAIDSVTNPANGPKPNSLTKKIARITSWKLRDSARMARQT